MRKKFIAAFLWTRMIKVLSGQAHFSYRFEFGLVLRMNLYIAEEEKSATFQASKACP